MPKTTYLVTGASAGIGAVYADRLAHRGHDLVLVARRLDRLRALADRLQAQAGVSIECLAADLACPNDLNRIEQRLRSDSAIGGLVNNAGIANDGGIRDADAGNLARMIDLNVRAVTLLSAAIASRLARTGSGTIINIASVTALIPQGLTALYPATKAFVLAFSQALQAELGPCGVAVQAVLPGITRTALWSEAQLARLPAARVMEAEVMVDAALAGLDMGESVTIPALPDMAAYEAFVRARERLYPDLSGAQPAPRYAKAR
ncbi:SDR family oxidoreductase [Novosphingobium sp. 1949]|uniref:NADP-dependent 3-hydroxy acid dehydrogenase YdfG n=1 Tax=Novosphingobium organovorum TaxID=2930092 RepID=A0ABT0BHV8_9SPHN|nr:SDR family oxidoreductase [Novosphingobium organovorum]MCJ2184396.1 SDR family oxidoreductase [Novosphingobium organovorum]